MQTLRFKGLSLVLADDRLLRTVALAKKAAACSAPVLICGESGTGKELIARYIHENSKMGMGPYISVNCAAIPEGLMEAELFGFERGAFTGALSLRIGKFERAHNGTLLLDEISEMSINLQAKLLRVLQEGEVDRLGGKDTVKINSRVIATTNRDPVHLVRKGLFREDLFFRLNVIRIDCEPLRGRRLAIEYLVEEFLRQSAINQGKNRLKISREAMKKLVEYEWPGNIRELQNTLERAVLLTEKKEVGASQIHLTGKMREEECGFRNGSLAEVEKQHILSVLEATGGKKKETAERLGISARTLRNKLDDYGCN